MKLTLNFVQPLRTRFGAWGIVLAGAIVVAALAAAGGTYALFLGGTTSQVASSPVNLQKGLVGNWKLDGNAKDSTPYAHDGTAASVTYAADRTGQASDAASFNGTSSNITATSQIQNLTAYSMSVWFKPNANCASIACSVLSAGAAGQGGSPRIDWGNSTAGTGPAQIGMTINGSGCSYYSATKSLNTWYHAVLTVSGTAVRFYINGQQAVSCTATAGAVLPTNVLTLGLRGGSSAYFSGLIDDTRVYNRALSATEATALYKESGSDINAAQGQSGLIGQWDCDNNAKDSSPYADNATASGTTAYTADRNGVATSACNLSNGSLVANVPTTHTFTTTAWVYGDYSGTTKHTYVKLYNSANTSAYVGNYKDQAANEKSCYISDGSGSNSASATGFGLVTGQWNFVACTWDGTTVRDYVGGVQRGSSSYTSSQIFNKVSIGCNDSSSPCTIDDARVYNRALSATELATLYKSSGSQLKIGTYSQNVSLNSGLLAWWPFNGNAKDMTPYSNNGTVTGATPTADRNGRANSAYALGNSAQYINMGTVKAFTNLTSTGFTYSLWMERTGTSTGQWPEVMGASSTHDYYGIRTNTYGERIYFEYGKSPWDGSTYASLSYPSSSSCYDLALNEWHLVTATYTGTTLKLYCDGVLSNTTTSAGLSPKVAPFTFTTSSSGWVGSIDDARVYGRALTAAEVQALYGVYY